MSSYNPNAKVTINGNSFDSVTLAGVQVSYGRQTIWEQPRAGYSIVNILNTTNTDYQFQPNQSVVIEISNSSGTPITIFTGKITTIKNTVAAAGSIGQHVIHQITALSPLARMSRDIISADFPKEFDNIRLNTILTNAGVTIDTIDAGVYEFQAITAGTADAYSLASKYAQMAFGYIYDTPSGKIGFANESRRFVDQRDNGYLSISKSYLLERDISSSKETNNLLNDVLLTYRAGTVTSQDTTSQSAYGLAAGTITTELHNLTDAQIQADRYITLRSTPRTNLGQFSIALDPGNITASDLNALINMYHGKPIKIQNLPTGIKNQTYKGFVEGWTFSIGYQTASITIISTDASLSIVPTRWQDVQATLKWSDVDPAIQWATYDG